MPIQRPWSGVRVAPAFVRDLAFGARGVARARAMLLDIGGTVEDVQHDRRWQRMGVDLVWHRTGGPAVLVEVKLERNSSANLALESISDRSTRRPGWWQTSHADLVLYGFADRDRWFVLHLPTLRRVFRGERFLALRHVVARTPGSHETSCRLLPIREGVAAGGVVEWADHVPDGFLVDVVNRAVDDRGAPSPRDTKVDSRLPAGSPSLYNRRCRA